MFDRFPKLRIVVGHLGEGLPFWLFRLDFMHRATVGSKRYDFRGPLKKKPSDYLRENVWVTTSGMGWAPAILLLPAVPRDGPRALCDGLPVPVSCRKR